VKRPAWLVHPLAPSLLLFAGLIVGGFAAIGIGWKVAARTLFVPFQTPALVSGAMGGLALVLVGVILANIQADRWLNAGERAETEELLDEAAALLDALNGKRA
jgi:hypothetical protein